MKKIVLPLTFVMLTLAGCFSSETQADNATASAATPDQFVEGKDYVEIFPEINTDAENGKVEVVELFWLGCPHCYHLEPTIKQYLKDKPDYVQFKQVPAVLNPQWTLHARAFYVARLVDPEDQRNLVGKMFEEIHDKKNRLGDEASIRAFFAANGVNQTQFNNTWNSMALSAAMSHATTISKGSQATSVPTLIIDGKYRTSPSMANGEVNLIKIVNKLTQQAKAEK